MLLIFKESRAFERSREEHLDDVEFRALQTTLLENPTAGLLIRGTRGLRKLRWSADGTGRRGGLRIIYYVARESCLLLLLYRKGAQDDLTPDQVRFLMRLVEAEFAAGGE